MSKLDLDIVFPIFNEAQGIRDVIDEWDRELKGKIRYRFIAAEDGSDDGTKDILKRLKTKYPMLLEMKKARGNYSKAVKRGIKASEASYILCVDSDGQCNPADLWKLWKIRKKADIVIGWRYKRADTKLRRMMSGFFKIYYLALFPIGIHDPSCPYVLFRKDDVKPFLRKLGVVKEGFWWEFNARAYMNNLSFREVRIMHRLRKSGETQVYKPGKLFGIWYRHTIAMMELRLKIK